MTQVRTNRKQRKIELKNILKNGQEHVKKK